MTNLKCKRIFSSKTSMVPPAIYGRNTSRTLFKKTPLFKVPLTEWQYYWSIGQCLIWTINEVLAISNLCNFCHWLSNNLIKGVAQFKLCTHLFDLFMGGIKNALQRRVGNSAFAETQKLPLHFFIYTNVDEQLNLGN